MTNILIAIDMRDPAQVEAFGKVWRLSDERRAEIQRRAAADRQFENDVRTMGMVAAVSARVQRTMTGAPQ